MFHLSNHTGPYFFTYDGLVDVALKRLKIYKKKHSFSQTQILVDWLLSEKTEIPVHSMIIKQPDEIIDQLCKSLQNVTDNKTNHSIIINHYIPILITNHINPYSINFSLLARILHLAQELIYFAGVDESVITLVRHIREIYAQWKYRMSDRLRNIESNIHLSSREALINTILLLINYEI